MRQALVILGDEGRRSCVGANAWATSLMVRYASGYGCSKIVVVSASRPRILV